jgi:hypothetical protein
MNFVITENDPRLSPAELSAGTVVAICKYRNWSPVDTGTFAIVLEMGANAWTVEQGAPFWVLAGDKRIFLSSLYFKLLDVES